MLLQELCGLRLRKADNKSMGRVDDEMKTDSRGRSFILLCPRDEKSLLLLLRHKALVFRACHLHSSHRFTTIYTHTIASDTFPWIVYFIERRSYMLPRRARAGEGACRPVTESDHSRRRLRSVTETAASCDTTCTSHSAGPRVCEASESQASELARGMAAQRRWTLEARPVGCDLAVRYDTAARVRGRRVKMHGHGASRSRSQAREHLFAGGYRPG